VAMTASERDTILAADDTALLTQADVEFFRSSGPGGQHRNKVETGVRLRHRATGVSAAASERRSQMENRKRALRRLRQAIALEVRAAPVALGEFPADLQAILRSSRWPRLSARSLDLWRLAACVLDHLTLAEGRVSDVAKALGASTASLVKFLGLDNHLWQAAGAIRKAAGLAALRK
jgi:RF-1 domain